MAVAIAAEMGAKWGFSPAVAADGFLRPKLPNMLVPVRGRSQEVFMEIHSNSFQNDGAIPAEFAFGKVGTAEEPIALSANRNPHLAWTGAPLETQSFALACIDTDAPTKADDVNKKDRQVPADLPRANFTHWLIIDIPAYVTEIAAGSCSDGITAHGKRAPKGPEGSRQGRNDYTGWFASDPNMAGEYFGYDGPCPPFNDSVVHHYHFHLYALDTGHLKLPPVFDWKQLQDAVKNHTLDKIEMVGTYTLNPALGK
jgi:Raf kinase inhibitor-like YbhB/YbcL family protein